MTISPEYLALNKKLHQEGNYGLGGFRNAHLVKEQAKFLHTTDILDYGCGTGSLGKTLRAEGFQVAEYDPAIEGKDSPPEPADLVFCGDVAEHVEPEYLEAFLDDLRRVTRALIIIIVATYPAKKVLADGRNAHLIINPMSWWLGKLEARFRTEFVQGTNEHFVFMGHANDYQKD